MKANEVLLCLQRMQKTYSEAMEFYGSMPQYVSFLEAEMIQDGFCSAVRRMFICGYYSIMGELRQDYLGNRTGYWYMSPMSVNLNTIEEIQAKAIKPRLDHLNHTIARLQKQLKQSA